MKRCLLILAALIVILLPAADSAFASSAEAPTAERASRNATSYGFTIRRRAKPKLLMARAAAPMLRGLRVATRTTRRRSN